MKPTWNRIRVYFWLANNLSTFTELLINFRLNLINGVMICNYILFTKLSWSGDSEGAFWSLIQAVTFPPVFHARWRLHTVPWIAERQAGKLWLPIFIVFGLTRLIIEPVSTFSQADALSTRLLISIISAIFTTSIRQIFPITRIYERIYAWYLFQCKCKKETKQNACS